MKIMNYWAVFQILLGIWLFISPFAFGFTELTNAALNSMIVGVVVAITGLAAFLFEAFHRQDICRLEQMERKSS